MPHWAAERSAAGLPLLQQVIGLTQGIVASPAPVLHEVFFIASNTWCELCCECAVTSIVVSIMLYTAVRVNCDVSHTCCALECVLWF